MMRVTCLECGKEQVWQAGQCAGDGVIEIIGDAVMCSCGHSVEEVDGVLQEFQTDVNSVSAEMKPVIRQ